MMSPHTFQDLGGADKIPRLLRHFYEGMNACIFVVDSNDPERMEDAKRELHYIMSEKELDGVPLMVFANKQV